MAWYFEFMRALGFLSRLASLGLLSISLFGCGADSGSGDACTAGDVQACNGAAGCLGSQTCDAAGSGWGDCDCSVSPYPDASTPDAGSADGGSVDAG